MYGRSMDDTTTTKTSYNSISTNIHNTQWLHPTFLIGVAGASGSGKSSVCQTIMKQLEQEDLPDNQRKVVCISIDSFYNDLSGNDLIKAAAGQYDFDHPNALDFELMYKTLVEIRDGQCTSLPIYDYVTNSRSIDKVLKIYPADVVLFEGILAFYSQPVRELFNLKVFVDTDPDIRLAKRVIRDVEERGRDLDFVLNQYMSTVKPAFEEFCLPAKKFADVIIPRGVDNTVAISLIVQHIKDLLESRKRAKRNDDGGGVDGGSTSTSTSSSTYKPKRPLSKELSRPH